MTAWYPPLKINKCHLKRDHFKKKIVFQLSIFRGYVSFWGSMCIDGSRLGFYIVLQIIQDENPVQNWYMCSRVFKLVARITSDLRSSRPCSNARMGHIGVGFVVMSVPARSHLEWNHLPCRWMVWRKSWSDLKLGDWKTHLKENARFCVLSVGVRKYQWVLWIYVHKSIIIYIFIYIYIFHFLFTVQL